MVRRTYGSHGLYICQSSQLTGKFNRHLWTVCFVFADEAFFAGDRVGEGVLKSLITDPSMMVEPKGVDSFLVPNCLDLMMASNDKWVVPVGDHGRRFAVFAVNPRWGKNHCSDGERNAYFKALYEEINNGGVEAMMWDLAQRDLDGWHAEAFPVTAALIKQKQQTLRGFDKALESWLQTGVLPRNERWNGRPDCATTAAMMDQIKKLRGCEYETDSALKAYLREFQIADTNWRTPGEGNGGAKFLALSEARSVFAERYGGAWPWDESVGGWGK